MAETFLGSRLDRDVVIGVAGQSLAGMMLNSGGAKTLSDALIANALNPVVRSVELADLASGGSTSTKTHAYALRNIFSKDIVRNDLRRLKYWYDLDNDRNGPALDRAINLLAALPRKPTVIFWDQGQSDIVVTTGRYPEISAARAVTEYMASTRSSWSALRFACSPDHPERVPIFVGVLGRRSGAPPLGVERLRQAQLQLIAETPNVHHGLDVYDISLLDNIHPDRPGRREYGRRVGERIAEVLYGARDVVAPPSIAAVTHVSASVIDVAITVPAGERLIKPAHPIGFRLENSGGLEIPIRAFDWIGEALRLTIPEQTELPSLRFPYDYLSHYNHSGVILGARSGKPLMSVYGRLTARPMG